MNRSDFVWTLLFALLMGQVAPAQATGGPASGKIYIAILDDAREEMLSWKPGVAPDRLIRPAFEKTQKGWQRVTVGSMPTSWTIAFCGRNLGQIESKPVSQGAYFPRKISRYLTSVQEITTPSALVPSIGEPSEEYGPMGIGPTKGRRPLVLVSKPYTSDPDGWKQVSLLPSAVETVVRAAFRKDYSHVDRCKEEQIIERNWKYPASSLKFPAINGSNKNSYLVQTKLDAGDCGYVNDPNDPASDPWFYVPSNGKARRIGSFMSLLDSGDYDNNGRSELIFLLNEPEDTDGFILFDADLRKQADLFWTYH